MSSNLRAYIYIFIKNHLAKEEGYRIVDMVGSIEKTMSKKKKKKAKRKGVESEGNELQRDEYRI